MSRDQVLIVLIAAGAAAATVLLGLFVVWVVLRRRSLRMLIASVAVVAVAAVIAGMLGTAQAMFLSRHDLEVTALVAAVSGLVAVGGAYLVGTALARWSATLRAEARRFGTSGHFADTPVGPSEFRALSEELALTSEKLQHARRREEKIEKSRRELVSWVSHDLRTPLAGLRAMAEALEDGLAADPARYHRQIRVEVDRMVHMVEDLFELSRLEAGDAPLTLERVLLGDVVSEVIAGADPVAQARGVRLAGAVEQGLEVNVDASAMSRVVSNLVMNAIRHTHTDGLVEVRGSRGSGGIEIAVTDGCGGLTEAEMERVFDVAWQGSPARTPNTSPVFGSGAGFGLAIVRGIVTAHQGKVSVHNQPPGCRFVVALPD